jgi:hypothetical protein
MHHGLERHGLSFPLAITGLPREIHHVQGTAAVIDILDLEIEGLAQAGASPEAEQVKELVPVVVEAGVGLQ